MHTPNFSLKCINEPRSRAAVTSRGPVVTIFFNPKLSKNLPQLSLNLWLAYLMNVLNIVNIQLWKMGQVTPFFKKDNELYKANYRPLTVLLVLNNVFERLH